MRPLSGNWMHAYEMTTRRFTCGFCGRDTGTKTGYRSDVNPVGLIYVCGSCNRPTYFEPMSTQTPSPKPGAQIEHLPTGGVAELYEEVRAATSAGAFSAAVTIARTLLSHVATDKGAAPKKSFLFYVEWLEKSGFTTGPMKSWVDHVRARPTCPHTS